MVPQRGVPEAGADALVAPEVQGQLLAGARGAEEEGSDQQEVAHGVEAEAADTGRAGLAPPQGLARGCPHGGARAGQAGAQTGGRSPGRARQPTPTGPGRHRSLPFPGAEGSPGPGRPLLWAPLLWARGTAPGTVAVQAGDLLAGWDEAIPSFEPGSKVATRSSGGKVLNGLAQNIPWLVGGDADLSCSTKTLLGGLEDFHGQGGNGRNVRYGVREHAMGAIANGMAYHGGVRTFTGTFFVFSDYMRPSMRLAAMNHLPVTFVFTHDSIAVGEDGPTHQPVEHLMSLRAMPELVVLRPCDANETAAAWRFAMSENERPLTLVLSRQNLPTLQDPAVERSDSVSRGAYVLRDPEGLEVKTVLIATGAEVHLALEAQKELAALGIGARVVSMPSWELFAEQDPSYQDSVLPPDVRARVSIEAGATFGWERWIGREGVACGLDRFGASAPGGVVLEELGFTTERVVRTVQTLLA